jgi:probable F420-dependent oxidoreductase
MPTRLGLGLPQMHQYDLGKDVPDVARAAEEIGYDSLWVFERALFPEPADPGLYGMEGLPWPDAYRGVAEPLVTLTLAAAATERARLGTSVLVAPLHIPFQLAKSLATLDAASGGRVVAGLGTGWSLDEYAAAGVRPFEERGKVLDEVIEVCRAVWGPDPVVVRGPLTRIASAVVGPKPARPIPILLPGQQQGRCAGSSTTPTAGCRYAMGAEQVAAQWRELQDLAAERGRTGRSGPWCGSTRTTPPSPTRDRTAPFQGTSTRSSRTSMAHAEIGLDEFLVDLSVGPAGRPGTQGRGRRGVREGAGGRGLNSGPVSPPAGLNSPQSSGSSTGAMSS